MVPWNVSSDIVQDRCGAFIGVLSARFLFVLSKKVAVEHSPLLAQQHHDYVYVLIGTCEGEHANSDFKLIRYLAKYEIPNEKSNLFKNIN